MLDAFKKLFGYEREQKAAFHVSDEVRKFLKDFTDEALEKREDYSVKLTSVTKYKELKSKPEEFKKEFIFALINNKNGLANDGGPWGNSSYWVKDIWSRTLSLSVRSSELSFSDEELLNLIKGFVSKKRGYFHISEWPFNPILSKIQQRSQEEGLNSTLNQCLVVIKSAISKRSYIYSDEQKILKRIKSIRQKPTEFSIDTRDKLGKSIDSTIRSFKTDKQLLFQNLLKHFAKGSEKSTPTISWLKSSDTQIENIGKKELSKNFILWIEAIIGIFQKIHKDRSYEFRFVSDENLQLLRAAVWSGALINDKDLNQSIEDLGLWSFKKLLGHGAVSVKLGNGCIYAFSKLPYQDGISRLTKFRMKIKYPSVRNTIGKAIGRVAKAEGKTMDEIEELAVQDFGLDANYQLIQNFGDYIGLGAIVNSSTFSLLWQNDKGKQIRSIPKYVKDNYPEELKDFKKKIKDIQSNLTAQKSRIEKIFLGKREWEFDQWKRLYLENKLLGFFGTKLIWSFTIDNKTTSAIFRSNEFVNYNGVILESFENAKVELWHPVNASVEEVQSWRNWLETNEVKQPFKQAHRELYIVTDAEKNTNSYSNRFAAHILRQHIFIALCRERGWGYTLQGQWDSHNTPTLIIPAWKYRIEFWADGVEGSANDSAIFNYLQTDQVRFYDEESQVDMADVPAIVFSEAMRDVDLFVGVTSIGADPNWRDGGEERFHGYWSDFSFGDLAISGKERKKLLENIIPKLKIAGQCSFEGNFLVVKGSLRIYKIHMGSGNILMKPNAQYLCIVADRSKSKDNVFLPFEGDTTLSVILSKAFMLAEDTKIKDRTIISQINR